MKIILYLFLLIISFPAIAQNVEFEDPQFKAFIVVLGYDTNSDGEIQISEANEIFELEIENSEATSISGIKSFNNLRELKIIDNFYDVDVSGMESIVQFNIGNQYPETNIDLSSCINLQQINTNANQFSCDTLLLNDCASLLYFDHYGIQASYIDFTNCSGLTNISLNNDNIVSTSMNLLGCTNLSSLDLNGSFLSVDIENLENFERLFFMGESESINLNNLPLFSDIFISGLHQNIEINDSPEIYSISMSGFSNSENLIFDDLQKLRTLDIWEISDIEIISAKNCPLLEDVTVFGQTNIDTLDFSNCPSLNYFTSDGFDGMTYLNLQNCTNLIDISAYSLQLTLDLSGCTSIEDLSIDNCEEINLSGCYNLRSVTFFGDTPEVIDLSSCIFLENLSIYSQPYIENLILQNTSMETLELFGTTINNICVDEEELESTQQYLEQENIEFNTLTTSCTFSSAGRPFVISGISYLDTNNDDCLTSNVKLPFSKYQIIDSLDKTKYFFANQSGKYKYPLREGTYTYKPDVLYGNDLFTLSPLEREVTFPSDQTEIIQDFCFQPGLEVDIIDVTLIPLEPARPGFDARYLITYKNTGNVTRGGDIKLYFQDDFMDFISSIPDQDVLEEGFLSWSFEDLIPYETRSIEFTMNLNSPMEDPALNGGDFVNFEAVVGPLGNQTVTSYWSNLKQEIVNSFDPNDKTCLNGDVLDQSMIGDFVKYMIRFENTGSAEAVNIVVTDSIDGTKFDIRTLEVLNSSHDVEVSTEGEVVNFIFKDIYLPFEDATNDGYVTFKIKTWPTLTLGDDLRNKAEIYFDFNFPIITNTTSTIISDLSNLVDINRTITADIFPNPTTDKITITTEVSINKVDIYDTTGRLIKSIFINNSSNKNSIDIGELNSGIYHFHIISKDGSVIQKIIKS